MSDVVDATHYDAARGEVTVRFPCGAEAILEVGHPAGPRPVVYLDQNQWIALARSLYSPDGLDATVRDGCAALIQLARDGSIILPLSSAHLVETSRRRGRSRHDLAMTMLQLSRGWQMRTPLDVRQRELRAELRRYAARPAPLPEPTPVFTLEPGALFAEGSRSADPDPEVWAARLCFVLLDDQPVPDARGRELAQLWATSHQELAAYQRAVTMPKEHVRINARARLLGDLSLEVARAAQAADLNQPELSRWVLEDADDSIARMPYVGRLQEVIWHRLSNADERWEPNDLNDVHFLACAAAYAHVVVGERKTIEYLRRAGRRCVPGAHACRTLQEAREHLAAPESS